MSVVMQGGKHRFTDLTRVCHWDRDRSGTKLTFSWFVFLKNDIFVSECSEDVCLWKMGPVCILVTMRRKNWLKSVITFISPIRINGLKAASCLLKGRGHVTLIQEMNAQWDISLSKPSLSLSISLKRILGNLPVYRWHSDCSFSMQYVQCVVHTVCST